MRIWNWRDALCKFLSVAFGSYAVKTMCGKCERCNGVFAAWGVIPCPMRLGKATPASVSLAAFAGPVSDDRYCEKAFANGFHSEPAGTADANRTDATL